VRGDKRCPGLRPPFIGQRESFRDADPETSPGKDEARPGLAVDLPAEAKPNAGVHQQKRCTLVELITRYVRHCRGRTQGGAALPRILRTVMTHNTSSGFRRGPGTFTLYLRMLPEPDVWSSRLRAFRHKADRWLRLSADPPRRSDHGTAREPAA